MGLSYVPSHILGKLGKQRKAQIAHNRAARLALHCPIRTQSTDSMHRILLWLPVEKRFALSTVTFFRNGFYSTKLEFLCSQIINCSVFHSHFTRTAGDGTIKLPCPKCNASTKYEVIYCAVTHWNSSPLHIRLSYNKSSFKCY